MSDFAEVTVLVEGMTEQRFIKQVLGPYLAERKVYLTPIILDKPGQKGGDVRFVRAKNDIEKHLKQRRDTWVTLLVDYYGIKPDWPGHPESKTQIDHVQKFEIMRRKTGFAICELIPDHDPARRFIPYFSMHELEALFFSDPACLALKLGITQQRVDEILQACGEPEKINDRMDTAPSKRLEKLNPRYKKTTTGIAVAESIGVETMRAYCPIFNGWISCLEELAQRHASTTYFR